MRVSCSRQELSRGLSLVNHAVSSRATLPILAHLLLSTEQGRLKLAATNLETSITTWITAHIEEEGVTTLPAKLLADLVNALATEDVELVKPIDAHTVQVSTGRTRASLRGLAPDEFPLIPTHEGSDPPITLEASVLKEVIEQVAFAAANDDTRPVLTAVCMQTGEEGLTFAAADSFRLAVRTVSLPESSEARPDLLIPARTLLELARILPADGPVELLVTPQRSQVLFHTPTLDLVSRLIEGTFPNFRQIIPAECTTCVVVDTNALARSLKAAALFARESANIVTLTVAPGDSAALTVEASTDEVGEHTSVLEASVTGPAMRLVFNVRYLTDALAVIDAPEVALEFASPSRPAALKPVGHPEFLYVAMPMHVNR
jgi:DNA polymerase III subunit beta